MYQGSYEQVIFMKLCLQDILFLVYLKTKTTSHQAQRVVTDMKAERSWVRAN